uniref:FAD-binding oxidoreductase n=1 Tax=Micrococcus terreus TaxID=574650 RepID=UPI00301AB99F
MPAPDSFLHALVAVFPEHQLTQDEERLAEYSVDKGPLEGLVVALPVAVVHAESVEDVQQLMRLASEHRVPVVTRGAGTGVSGGANALPGGVVLSTTRMDRILQLNPEDGTAVVEPGVINADLNTAAAAHGLMYAPDPASYRTSTIGGNIATNAGGLRCAKYGVTRDSVLAVDVVLADGSLIRTGHQTIKGVVGYDLTGLFTGSEGTLGVIVGATVRLRPAPVQVLTLAAWLPDFPTAAAGVLQIGAARVTPAILEIMCQGPLSSAHRRPVFLPAGGHQNCPLVASWFARLGGGA